MVLDKQNADALRECLRIVSTLYPASDHREMAYAIELCIDAGNWPPAFSRKHIPILFYPNDPARADQLREDIDRAVESGALHIIEGLNAFYPSHLALWKDCPPVPLSTPFRYWLPVSMHEPSASVRDAAFEVTPPAQSEWSLKEPKRYQGYARPLYLALKAAHRAGDARPNARGILESFRKSQPSEIAQVNHDGLIYLDSDGNTKEASLPAIGEAIRRMTS